jgi:hypothetical protein
MGRTEFEGFHAVKEGGGEGEVVAFGLVGGKGVSHERRRKWRERRRVTNDYFSIVWCAEFDADFVIWNAG